VHKLLDGGPYRNAQCEDGGAKAGVVMTVSARPCAWIASGDIRKKLRAHATTEMVRCYDAVRAAS
jgi:hypothetical protein